jgi:hypothetical protein
LSVRHDPLNREHARWNGGEKTKTRYRLAARARLRSARQHISFQITSEAAVVAVLGTAVLAMWWDIAPEVRADFEDWHAHEHFPERLGVPGFRRATRWSCADGGEGMFVIYELDGYEVLTSPAYAAHLNSPTPWSTRLMPHHRNMVRSQCHVLESEGAVTARHAVTVRLSPAPEQGGRLRATLRDLAADVKTRPGLVGLHLLRHETPDMRVTTEQRIRGDADRVADWVLVVSGYDRDALNLLQSGDLAEPALQAMGASPGAEWHIYSLAYSATPGDAR